MDKQAIEKRCEIFINDDCVKKEIKYIVSCEGVEGFTENVYSFDKCFDIIYDAISDEFEFDEEDEDEIIAIITPFAKKMQKIYVAKQKKARIALRAIRVELYG